MPPLPYPTRDLACPIDALPEPCRSAVVYAIAKKKVHAHVALTDAIAAMASVIHCGYDCEAPDGSRMPTTINTCAVAPTRSGKGTSMKVFFRLFLNAEVKPSLTKYVMRTISPVALVESLDGSWKNLTIQREEGESFLTSELFKKEADALTQLWSGGLPLDRTVRGKELTARDARCSVGFRIQPVFMKDYLLKNRLAYKLGFWPRAIAGLHDPERFPANSAFQIPTGAHSTDDRYQRRLLKIADRLCRKKPGSRTLIQLSIEAKAFMLELDHVLRDWEGMYYVDVGEALGRAWENTLRLATVLHVFCIGRGRVSRELMERAWKIVEWSLFQHQLIFVQSLKVPSPNHESGGDVETRATRARQPAKAPKQPRPMENANWVLQCLGSLVATAQTPWVAADDVLMLSGLNSRAFQAALGWLVLEKRVRSFQYMNRMYLELLLRPLPPPPPGFGDL